tara:strand:- start:356 stop:529 length:174 start_codon:yes stop_codon:yes gene_type:complete
MAKNKKLKKSTKLRRIDPTLIEPEEPGPPPPQPPQSPQSPQQLKQPRGWGKARYTKK